ncbi:accessory gene regulator ArgB-like protein [Anaerosporobacter sp.]
MITKIANKLTLFLVDRGIISREDIPIYAYGYEALLGSIVNSILVVVLGLIFHQGLQSIVFLVVFALTRVYSGGYHAQSYLKCNLTLASAYIIMITLTEAIVYSESSYATVVFVLFYLSVILRFAPVPNPKKQTSEAERIKFREKILLLSAMWTIVIIVLSFFYIRIALNVAITLFVVAVLIVIQKIIGREEEIHNEKIT